MCRLEVAEPAEGWQKCQVLNEAATVNTNKLRNKSVGEEGKYGSLQQRAQYEEVGQGEDDRNQMTLLP